MNFKLGYVVAISEAVIQNSGCSPMQDIYHVSLIVSLTLNCLSSPNKQFLEGKGWG